MHGTVARRRAGGEGGYTFVEMMVATTIAVIVGLGIYAIFSYQRRASESQRIVNQLQTGCRFAMDQIKRELALAGYRAQNTARPVSVAVANEMAFEYWDDRASSDAPFDDAHYDRHALISFRLDGSNLVRTQRRWHTGSNSYQPGSTSMSEDAVRADFAALNAPYRQTLASDVDAFALQYFKQNNEAWSRDPDGNPATPPPFDEIRSVVVSLQCRSAEANPFIRNPAVASAGDKYPVVRLQSLVRLRNVDIATNPRDTQPPATPTNLRVWDPGLCDTLEVAWDANRDSDLAGYTLYHGLASGVYSDRVRIAKGPGAAGERVRHTLTGLQATRACDTASATYYVKVEAFDKSGNPSVRSAEVSGNPAPSIATEAGTSAAANDTTVNPASPPAPAGFAASTPADNQVQLGWARSGVSGLVGYRLYRSASSASFAPLGTQAGVGNCIADERALGPDALSFLDTGVFLDPAILQGCTAYHYKLAAVHCDGCLPEVRMNFASVTATAVDTTPPPCPTISAHDGWRRIVLSLENPLRSAVPDFSATKVWFSRSDYPTYSDNGTPGNPADDSVTGAPIPDTQLAGSPGTFTADGTVTVNFDSESVANPGPPELALDAAYYFLAVGYDRCGNVCSPLNSAASRTKGEQCADCLPGEPCFGAPSAPSQIAATAGCGDGVVLSWVGPDTTVHPDFTGFHVYRCARQFYSQCTDADWQELTNGGYVWDPAFTDTKAQGLEEGGLYSYRIRSTDCYYEDHHRTWPATGDPGNDPQDNYSDAYLENVAIGRVERQERFPGPSALLQAGVSAGADRIPVSSEQYLAANFPADAVSGARTILIGEEVLVCSGVAGPAAIVPGVLTASAFTGCSRGADGTPAGAHASGAPVLPRPPTRPIQAVSGDLAQRPPTFLHNTVAAWVRNTSAGPLTLTALSAAWQNPASFLERIALGDGASTPLAHVWADTGNPLTNGSTGSSLTLSNGEIYALDQLVPLVLSFAGADRTVSGRNEMREELLDLELGYRNNRTGDASCRGRTTVSVPLGPRVTGTTQNSPQEGTVASAVPGDGGLNPLNIVLVPGDLMVDVQARVSDSDYVGIREVRLYYHVDAGRTLGAAPPLSAGARYDRDPALDSLAPYRRIAMVPVAGNQWRTPAGEGIPASNDANVWYFIVAVDNNGNFDREPEAGSGAFQYYQQPYDVCQNIPRAPALAGSASSTTVTLSWAAPALNTNGTSFTDPGGYAVYRSTSSTGPVRLATLPAGASTYVDSPPAMAAQTYSYYVTALDTCSNPGPNEGAASNWYTECQGASGCTVRLATNQQNPAFFQAGDGFTIELFACEKLDGQSGQKLFVQVCSGADANVVGLAETADTGVFRIDAGASGQSGSEVTTWVSKPGDADLLDLRVGAVDTVAVHGWSDTVPGGGCGSLTQCSASLGVQTDPCVGIPAPAAPSLTVSVAGACNSTKPVVDLSWTGADPGAGLFYRIYRCSNANNKADCAPLTDGGKIYPVGAEPDRGQTGRTATDSPGLKADNNRIWYQVEAVRHNGCANSALWRTAASPAVVDSCP